MQIAVYQNPSIWQEASEAGDTNGAIDLLDNGEASEYNGEWRYGLVHRGTVPTLTKSNVSRQHKSRSKLKVKIKYSTDL